MSCDLLSPKIQRPMLICVFYLPSFLFMSSCSASAFTSSASLFVSLFYLRPAQLKFTRALSSSFLLLLLPDFFTALRRSPIWEVSSGALKAVASSRLCRLALPRPAAAGWQPIRPLSPTVSNKEVPFSSEFIIVTSGTTIESQ